MVLPCREDQGDDIFGVVRFHSQRAAPRTLHLFIAGCAGSEKLSPGFCGLELSRLDRRSIMRPATRSITPIDQTS